MAVALAVKPHAMAIYLTPTFNLTLLTSKRGDRPR
jgi:hypothetical protein